MDGLDSRGLTDKVNIIIVSDHGMADTSVEHLIFLDDYIDMKKVIVVDNMPIEMLYPREGEGGIDSHDFSRDPGSIVFFLFFRFGYYSFATSRSQ